MTDPDARDDAPGRHAAESRPPSLLERWNATEPIRVAIYPVAAAVVALLVGYGVLTVERSQLWLAVVVAVVGGGLPVLGGELARRSAWAPATVRETVDAYREHEFAEGWHAALEQAPAPVDEPEPTRPVDAHPPTQQIPRISRGVPPSTT